MLTNVILDPILRAALDEDLRSGDLTTEACVSSDRLARAEAVARHELVVCGGDVFARVFALLDPRVTFERCLPEGAFAAAGEVAWRVRGPAQSLLMAERVALNFAQRMCGIASLARKYALAAAGARVTDTRKTTPGLRVLERYAVRTGGAHNHRDNLGSAVMIKDNHIVAAGGIGTAVERARARAPHTSRIEVEVQTLAELEQALDARADIVMLDNMDTPTISLAIARCRSVGRPPHGPIVEVSGGVTLARIPELVATGVDVISVGALTHSAKAADIALELYDA